MKVICMYLPQYHEFKENSEWWGEGYTEWVAVKRAQPLFKGHIQPKVPIDGHYYDLVKEGVETLMHQAELANQYGVYGFSFYQYWFCGRQLMEQPMELLLAHPEIPLRYQICWANESWTRTWYGLQSEVLMEQTYGGEKEWEQHFQYLLRFFQDERYIKIDNKPVFQIYRTMDIECLPQMLAYFHKRAAEEGFDGIYVVSGNTAGQLETRRNLIDGYYNFEPGFTLKHHLSSIKKMQYNVSVFVRTMYNKISKKKVLERIIPAKWILDSIERRSYDENEYPGLIVDWDNTPRRSYKGLLYKGTNPARFEQVLRTLKDKLKDREQDFIYINAWNEWGEGAHVEPDQETGYGYLEAIRAVTAEK